MIVLELGLSLLLESVFLPRGLAGYLPMFAAMTSEEPFRTLDQRFYSPLCIALGVAFAVLLSGVSI